MLYLLGKVAEAPPNPRVRYCCFKSPDKSIKNINSYLLAYNVSIK
jgi:hypothetical protein